MGNPTADLVTELREFARAYPTDVFGPVTEAELQEHANLITRNSAAMGRHFGPWFTRAADEIDLAFQMLETHCVSRERAKSVANGIQWLGIRKDRVITNSRVECERLRGLLQRVLASGRLTGHALADEIRAVDMEPR